MLSLITPPSEQVLTLTEVKAHLNVDHSDDDSKITILLAAAHARLDGRDGILGRCLRLQTWELRLDNFPGFISDPVCVPLPPLIEVVSVKYLDETGVLRTLTAVDDYYVIEGGWGAAEIHPTDRWPATDDEKHAVRVQFTAGYEDTDSPETNQVPENIRLAMLMLCSSWYENRSNELIGTNVQEMPIAVSALLAQHRVIPVS